PFYSNVGVFAENPYNNQISGFQGVAVGGRWLYRPINDGTTAFHIGAAFHYGHLNSGETVDNVKKTVLILGTPMETAVDPTEFVQAILPYANNVYNINAELMYVSPKFFARGEYMWKHVTKKRDDQTLFEANLGSIDSWGTLESWQAGNPLGSNSFNGAYVEAGYKIFGPDYKYNSAEGLLGGLSGRSLEIVARYSYTGLNDLVDGEYYSAGRDQYYPNGVIADYPATSLSVGGGNLHSFTIGANYSFNKFVQVMLEYNYNHLDRDKYMSDSNFNCIQGRLMFSF
ncbi:porin, partial [uncultured Muribaculum sp.]